MFVNDNRDIDFREELIGKDLAVSTVCTNNRYQFGIFKFL